MDTSISGDRYVAYSIYTPQWGFRATFLKSLGGKKKTDPHACTHKNDPKRFSDDFATN